MEFKNKVFIFVTISISFFSDRISKILILDFLSKNNFENYYYNSFTNFILVWNKGVAFGIMHSEGYLYHLISVVIFLIIIFLIYLSFISEKKIEILGINLIIGGALGNFYDRIYYNAVPDFIDFHYKGYHWFTFNVADIFITLGVLIILFFDTFRYKIKN